MEAYAGTILLVTHDRYLVDALATQIWEIQPDESTLSVFNGTYSQMKEERERLAALAAAEAAAQEAARAQVTKARSASLPNTKEERKKKAQLQELENTIAALEARLAEIGRKLENRAVDPAEVVKLGKEYQSVQQEMDARLADWEALQV
jgi:ATP-binding cassette subfamily F protein 3